MAIVTSVTLLLILIFYKELLVTISTPAVVIARHQLHSHALRTNGDALDNHRRVRGRGCDFVIAMLILPGATASLLVHRRPMFVLTLVRTLLGTVGGVRGHVAGFPTPGRWSWLGRFFHNGMGVQPKPRAAPTMVWPQTRGVRPSRGNCLTKG